MNTYAYSDPRPLAWIVCGLAAVYGLLTMIQFGYDLDLGLLFSRAMEHVPGAVHAYYEHLHPLAQMEGTLINLRQLILILNSILFLVWLYLAASNVRALGARRLDYTPGWTVGWFFVPFVNLVKPCLAIQEIWMTSHDPSQRRVCASHWPVLVWWVLRLATLVVVFVASEMLHSHDPETARNGIVLTLAHLTMHLVVTVLFIYLVWKTSRLQDGYRQTQSSPEPAHASESPVTST